MPRPTHLVSGAQSHPDVRHPAERHGSSLPVPRTRLGWHGKRVLATVMGSGALVLGAAYLVLATERMRLLGASPISAPAIAGAAFVAAGSILIIRAVRG
jgi:hypothetical protein